MSIWEQKATTSQFEDGGEYVPPPAGNHPAVLVGLIDLGTHTEEYQDQKKDRRRVYFVWEIKTDEDTYYVGKDFNLLTGETASLRKFAEAWRGKPFADGEPIPLQKMLGAACMLNLVHGKSAKGKTFAKIQGVAPMPRGLKVDKPAVTPWSWEIEQGNYPSPAWVPYLYGRAVLDVINDSHEMRGRPPEQKQQPYAPDAARQAGEDEEDEESGQDIPF